MTRETVGVGRSRTRRAGERAIASLLIVCVAVVGFWELMANRSRSPLNPFGLTSESLADFGPDAAGWRVLRERVEPDPLEPNILVLRLFPRSPAGPQDVPFPRQHTHAAVLVRLVHGYNMRDCMRIKGYKVALVGDLRDAAYVEDERLRSSSSDGSYPKCQIWRLTSGGGTISIWITSMLSAGDFSETDVDVRAMAFPRVGIPDDPGWRPVGLTLRSMRHPVRNLRLFLRSKWNSARCDLPTFLKLRRPAWASDELLTLVAASTGVSVEPASEREMVDHVMSAQKDVLTELQAWRLGKIKEAELGIPHVRRD